MAERYLAEHFPNLHLPGFRSEATLQDIAQPDTDWQPFISLSIYSLNPDNPSQLDVLTAIRTVKIPRPIHMSSVRPPDAFPEHSRAPSSNREKKHVSSNRHTP